MGKIGEFFGTVGGLLVAVPAMAVGSIIKAIETNGDWDQVKETAHEIGNSCIEGGAKIGAEAEPLIVTALSAVVSHYVHKGLKDGEQKGKQA